MAQGGECLCRYVLAMAAVVVLALLVLVFIHYKHPTYYASIDSVSGIGDDQGQPVRFFLTLGVMSRSPLWRHPCIDKGTAVEVTYHGVALVYGTISCELCAPLWDLWRTVIFMERSNVSGLPEFVVEGLVADAKRGIQVFDVTMHIPSTRQDQDDGKLVSCIARLAGDNSMSNACDVHFS